MVINSRNAEVILFVIVLIIGLDPQCHTEFIVVLWVVESIAYTFLCAVFIPAIMIKMVIT